MTLQGKGYYIWRVLYTEGGDAQAILDLMKEANLTHVLVKVAQGTLNYNYDRQRRIDLAAPLIRFLKKEGVVVWGWHYIVGEDPLSEARKAIQRVRELDLEGYIVNAEQEFKRPGMDVAARKYMYELRNALPDTNIALSSYRFPSYHPQFPWKAFLENCDLNMPQVYWEGAHNPDVQLIRSVREFQNYSIYRPIIPTGAAYTADGWKPTPEDALTFLNTVKSLQLPATNFWSWEHCRRAMIPVWDVIRDFPWPVTPTDEDITEKYIEALNSHDPLNVVLLYTLTGVHTDNQSQQTIQGPEALLAWYHDFLHNTLPEAAFELTEAISNGNTRKLTWKATSTKGEVLEGKDTMGVINGKISFHYKRFTVTPL